VSMDMALLRRANTAEFPISGHQIWEDYTGDAPLLAR